MNPRVKEVTPLPNFELSIIFTNNENRIFDVKPYLNTGVFQQLKNEEIFKNVRPFLGSIIWNNNIDLCPDTLYLESKIATQ